MKLDVLKKISPQKYQVYILGDINIDFFKMQYPFYENVAYTYKTHQSNKSHGCCIHSISIGLPVIRAHYCQRYCFVIKLVFFMAAIVLCVVDSLNEFLTYFWRRG